MIVKYKNTWLALGWLMVVAVFYLSLTPSPPDVFNVWDKLNHFLGYAILMAWFGQLYRSMPGRVFFAFYFIIMGACIEVLQGMGGARHFEVNDMLANGSGVIAAMLFLSLNGDRLLPWFEQRVLKVS